MIDTNVLVSASLFPKSRLGQAIRPISDKHTIILCTTIIDELHDVYSRKFPDKLLALETFLKEFNMCIEILVEVFNGNAAYFGVFFCHGYIQQVVHRKPMTA